MMDMHSITIDGPSALVVADVPGVGWVIGQPRDNESGWEFLNRVTRANVPPCQSWCYILADGKGIARFEGPTRMGLLK